MKKTILATTLFLSLLLLLCNTSNLLAQGIDEEGERSQAYEFLRNMGRGANFMASKMEGRHHSNHDFKLLAENHFTHCRIGGKFNLHIAAGPDFVIDADRIADMKEAADFCLANGLIAIIDPLHLYNEHYSDDQLPVLKKIWEQVSATFADYPVDRLAFEIMNEPHNGYDLKAIVHESLASIRGVSGNEERIVIVSGQGFSTRQALINAFQDNIFPTTDNYLIGTFHYYDPKSFTKQGTFGETTYWGENGENDPAWVVVEDAFDEVVNANQRWAAQNQTEELPVYLGEYGVDNEAPRADRKRWLCWIRMQAEERGFSTALWNMYSLTSKGIGPWTTKEKNDPSTRYFEEDMVDVLMTRYEVENAEITGGIVKDMSTQGYSGEGYANFSNALQGDNILLSSVYIPRTDTYAVTFRYRNSNSEEALVDISIYDSNMNLVSEKKDVAFPSSNQEGDWTKVVLELEFAGDTQSIIRITNSRGNQALVIDYFCISMGEYHDLLYPAEKALVDIPTGIENPTGSLDGQIDVYPTVFSEFTVIHSDIQNGKKVHFFMNDIQGRNIQFGVLDSFSGDISLGHEYRDGCYILNFVDRNLRESVKLIKLSGM